MHRLAVIVVLVIFSCGCSSFHVYPKEDRDVSAPSHRIAAVVTNPELTEETAILAYSGIYELENPGVNPVRITLQPLDARKKGGSLFVFVLFLGLVPVQHPDEYEISFVVEDTNGDARRYSYELRVEERWWLFDFLSSSRNREEKLGEALRAKILDSQ